MNESQNLSSTETADKIATLQSQVGMLKLVLIVITGAMVVYLYYQSRIIGKDVATIAPQAKPVIQLFTQNYAGMESLKQQLGVYATTHPDFQPILKKYGWTPQEPRK